MPLSAKRTSAWYGDNMLDTTLVASGECDLKVSYKEINFTHLDSINGYVKDL